MQVYVPGPVSIWIARSVSGSNQLPLPSSISTGDVKQYTRPNTVASKLLGYGESGATISIIPEFHPVQADIGGDRIETDTIFVGEYGIVKTILTVFNWEVFDLAMNRPLTAGRVAGVNRYDDIGTLLIREGGTYDLYVRFSYASAFPLSMPKTWSAGGVSGAINGYHFFAAYLAEDEMDLGAKASKVQVTFKCLRLRTKDINNRSGWSLYDHSMADTTDPNSGQDGSDPPAPG